MPGTSHARYGRASACCSREVLSRDWAKHETEDALCLEARTAPKMHHNL